MSKEFVSVHGSVIDWQLVQEHPAGIGSSPPVTLIAGSGMPKEQGYFGERGPRSASKNAKDKSNSATLRASQAGAQRETPGLGDMGKRMLRCDSEKDSEKDSGFSGSDSVHTDVDDRRSSVSGRHRESGKSLKISNALSSGSHRMPPYEELTHIYVIKNLMVKPSGPEQLLHGPMAWAGGWYGHTGAKATPPLLLIQQPGMAAPSSSTPTSSSGPSTPQVKKGGGQSRTKSSYLPILNSYPRIAPHPRKESLEGAGAPWVNGAKENGSEGQSQSKRVCTEEEKREAVSTSSQKEARINLQSKGNSFSSSSLPKPHQQSSGSDSVGSPSISSSQTPSPPSSSDTPSSSSSSPSSSTAHSPYHSVPDCSSSRQRRFLNTAEILNQSGLLAITLRTKELLKQNAATEREIAQLRQHTHLLCQVAQAGHSGGHKAADGLNKLLQVMSESGSYPKLDLHPQRGSASGGGSGSDQQSRIQSEEAQKKDIRKTHSNNQPQKLVSSYSVDDGTSPPSPLFAPSPEPEDGRYGDSLSGSAPEPGGRQRVTNRDVCDITMLPESSTHDLL